MRAFVLRRVVEWELAHLANRMNGPEEEPNTSDTAGCEQEDGTSDDE